MRYYILLTFLFVASCSSSQKSVGFIYRLPTNNNTMGCTDLVDNILGDPISVNKAKQLYSKARNSLKINWSASDNGCEARADLVAEVFEKEEGLITEKVWAMPPNNGLLSVYMNNAETELVEWNYHVANIVEVKNGNNISKMVIDPSLFEEPVPLDIWKARITKHSGNSVTFPNSSRLAYMPPMSYSGDSAERASMLSRRTDTLNIANDLNSQTVLGNHLRFINGKYIDELMANDPTKFKLFMDNRLANEQFGFYWDVTYHPPQFLELFSNHGTFFGIPLDKIKQSFDVTDVMFQQKLKMKYWDKSIPIFKSVNDKYKELKVAPDSNALAVKFKDKLKDSDFYNTWFSPFGAHLWREFGIDI
jgi:hypothetical protein